MQASADTVANYVEALLGSRRLGDQVAHHRLLEGAAACLAPGVRPWPRAILDLLAAQGIDQLYAHQARATDLVRTDRHVVVATPTASGKTLIYNLPVLERFLGDPECRALYLFPLKALAQDQLRNLEALLEPWPEAARPRAAIYDGDTTDHRRRTLRREPPNILMTNPEMLHLSFCPHHGAWSSFLAGLRFVVVDEVHTYRGVLGSHMAQVFRRLLRLCARYGAAPTFVFCSATVANPAELAQRLTGLTVETVTESGAPRGRRHFVFLNPLEGAAQAAILLLQAALHRGLRSIVYAQSRKVTELISLWAQQRSGPFRERISAYRAGFLPEERREIEARMAAGELLAVISTSALELGIDIGALDLCILVGYPGTVMATLQRGGRVGRSLRESAVLLVAHEDALDQYFMHHPDAFFELGAEAAVLNPDNPVILERHLECAAAELPLKPGEAWLREPGAARVAADMERRARLLRSADGSELFSPRKAPQHEINLRGAGGTYLIRVAEGPDEPELPAPSGRRGRKRKSPSRDKGKGAGEVIGSIDEHRAFKETHPGAVYLHKGCSYVVEDLDLETRAVSVRARRVDWFTRTRAAKTTEILELQAERPLWGTRLQLGRLKVTETVLGYETRRIRGNVLLQVTPLDLPPLVFETQGLWFPIPVAVYKAAEEARHHFMGGIHALEHAAIGIMPLVVMTDRNDLGGISTPMHPQLGLPAVFVYDGMPGGVGLSLAAFDKAEELLERTLGVIAACGCEYGCPACVHSPKCGSGNRPIDKAAALFLLEALQRGAPLPGPLHLDLPPASPTPQPPGGGQETGQGLGQAVGPCEDQRERQTASLGTKQSGEETPLESSGADDTTPTSTTTLRYGVLDVETRRSAAEVGGWHKADKMGVSVAVLYDAGDDAFHAYEEEQLPALLAHLQQLDLVVGFNIRRFDYRVLSCGAPWEQLRALPTLDLLEKIQERLGYRIALDNLAKATLGAEKSADGLQALAWWQEGRLDLIREYCQKDVALTRDLYRFGQDHGYLLFTNKAKQVVRLPLTW